MYSGTQARALYTAKKERDRERAEQAKKTAASAKPAAETGGIRTIQKASSNSVINAKLDLSPKQTPAKKLEQAPLVTAPELDDETKNQMNIAAMKLARQANFEVYNLVDSSIVKTDLNNNNANEEEFFDFLVFGCHGADDTTFQQQVADLAARLANDSKTKPKFVVVLGDNFYDSGVKSPNDELFKKRFYQIYELLAEYNIPCFPILGNHCENLHKIALLKGEEKGVDIGLRQVAHFYLGEPTKTYLAPDGKEISYSTPESKKDLATKGHNIPNTVIGKSDQHINLDLKQLPPWCMFNRFDSLIYQNTQFFLIDSNTFVSDYLNYLKIKKEIIQLKEQLPKQGLNSLKQKIENEIAWKQKELNENQVACIIEAYKEAEKTKKRVILVSHHSIKTIGKRAYEPDTVPLHGHIYFNKEEEKLVREHFKNLPEDASYNIVLDRCLQELRDSKEDKFAFDIILAAHDHAMYHYDDTNTNSTDPICQIVSGGGGGKLQHRLYFGSQKNVGCYLENYGLVRVKCNTKDSKDTEFCYYALENTAEKKKNLDVEFEIHFKQSSNIPVRDYDNISKDEKNKIIKLCDAVSAAIKNYFDFINTQQNQHHGTFFKKNVNLTHTYLDIKEVHKIWSYISNYKVENYKITLETLNHLMPDKISDHSFLTYLNKEISRCTADKIKTFDDFYKNEMTAFENSLLAQAHA